MRPLSRPLNAEAWRDVFVSALFEGDIAKLPERIAKAEEALALRVRELAHANGDDLHRRLIYRGSDVLFHLVTCRSVGRLG
jgi:hypothetical protein